MTHPVRLLRTRTSPKQPSRVVSVTVKPGHAHVRTGALNLPAAVGTLSGNATRIRWQQKNQVEHIELLGAIHAQVTVAVRTFDTVRDRVIVLHGKRVRSWLWAPSRFRIPFTPVHRSWMRQVGERFPIPLRQRMAAPKFKNVAGLEAKTLHFIEKWNEVAEAPEWATRWFSKIVVTVDGAIIARAVTCVGGAASKVTPFKAAA